MKRLEGYMTKKETAERLGVDEKTVDRRRKIEPLLAKWVKSGKRVWIRKEDVEQYLAHALKRGYV